MLDIVLKIKYSVCRGVKIILNLLWFVNSG